MAMGIVGNLRHTSFGEVMRLIGNGQKRGRLIVERGADQAMLYCDRGYILQIWRLGQNKPLARIWVEQNIITVPQLQQILMISGVADVSHLTDAQFVQKALESTIVSSEKVREWAMYNAVELVCTLLNLRDGDYRFEDNIMPDPSQLRAMLPIMIVLSRAAERIAATQVPPSIDVPLSPTDVLDFVDLEPDDNRLIELTTEQWHLLSRLDGVTTLKEMIDRITIDALAPNGEAGYDQRRYEVQRKENENRVVRLVKDLIVDGIVMARR